MNLLRRIPPPSTDAFRPFEPLRAPRNTIEIDLVAIWKEILGVEELGIDDDFLNLGGDSLKAAQIAARVAYRFTCDVPATAPLLLETVAKMAEVVAAATDAHGGRDVVWEVERITGSAPATFDFV